MNDTMFVIPTYRLQYVNTTVRAYSGNFKTYRHVLPIVIFDDSDISTSRQYAGLLEKAKNTGGIFYVGPQEKAQFLSDLETKTNIDRYLLQAIFQPSYGGNRNFIVIYTLGNMYISSDDDMAPYGIFEKESNGLGKGEVCKGRYIDRRFSNYYTESQDIVTAYLSVLGKRVSEIKVHVGLGKVVEDSAAELLTNTTNGELGQSTLTVHPGSLDANATVKVAQTYRTGSPDINASDYAREFLRNPVLFSSNGMTRVFAISRFIPCITDSNWRIDCGVSAYDNTEGLPPFIPTKLRFEDYIYRIWVAKNSRVAAAHVAAVQTHDRDPYNRSSIAQEFHNEELANYLKLELLRGISEVGNITLTFEGNVHFNGVIAREIIKRAKRLHQEAMSTAVKSAYKKGCLLSFARDILNTFCGFNQREFLRDTKIRLNLEYDLLKKTTEAWPIILEASLDMNKPMRRMG